MKTMRRVLAGIGVILMLALAQTASAISATGGDVATVGGCTYHTFTNNGTFTVTAGGNAQVLVVGGGGGGGASGGGGGAGGVRNYELVNLTPGDYTITVGTGGAGGITNGGEHYGATGDNSVFSGESISLTGGGGGGGAVYLDFDGEGALVVGEGLPGGSGGGGRGYSEAPGGLETGAGTGNNGGAASAPGTGSPNYGSGGGGGYAAAGVPGSSTAGGNGGAGLILDSFTAQLSAFSGMTVIASGGGGGCYWAGGENPVGTGGTGGTGAGNGSATDAQAGGNAVSFGSGGGGGGQGPALATGGNGAPGVVVVRYPPPSSLIRLVNIDFDHDLGYGFRTYDGPGALTNAAGVPRGGTYWNSAVEGTLVDPVKESDGITPSTVSVAFTGVNHYNVRNQPKSCQFGAALLDDFVYAGSGTAGFTISGLNDALTYDLYVYSQNGFYGNESPRFVVGSLTNDIVNAGDVTGFGLNINYAVFRNLTPAGGAISGTFESAGACPLNGLQIVEQSGGIKGTLIIIQ